mmetsp:Transcript_11120/g.16837  ORF Transcript_11120/g.16837 Transcript_11120/m.16837 type:complete len:328 (-) Transcript_11120:136-1119(-)
MALGVECSGLFHAAYLVPMSVERYQGVDLGYGCGPQSSNANNDNGSTSSYSKRCDRYLFWARVVMSLVLFSFALGMIVNAMFNGVTGTWGKVDDSLSLLLFLFMIIWVALVQGMQIALFALKKTSLRNLKRTHWSAYINFKAAFGTGNIEPFLIGRQIFVTASFFYLSKVTHLLSADDNAEGDPLSKFREFFVSNVLGVLVTAIPLLWGRLAAACMPRLYLSNLLILPNIYFCKAIGSLGIVDASWPIVAMLKSSYLGWYRCDADHLPNYLSGRESSLMSIQSTRSVVGDISLHEVSQHNGDESGGGNNLRAPLLATSIDHTNPDRV